MSMTTDTKRQMALHYLSGGILVTVVPDDDVRVRDLPPGAVAFQSGSLYVGKSRWPNLKEEIVKGDR